MTNAEIILKNSVFLMEEGLLKPTDEIITIHDEDGSSRQVRKPEPIHTFQSWKRLGFQVQKGEHAIAKFPIWKYRVAGRQEDEQEEDQPKVGKGRCFKKVAFFFTAEQVKPIGEGR